MSDDRTTPSHLVEVTQADRDCFKAIFDLTDETLDPNGDDKRALEIIARHRLSAQRSCDAEVVKWLRAAEVPGYLERADDPISAAVGWAADAIVAGKHRND